MSEVNDELLISRRGRALRAEINRPERRNAMNPAVLDGIAEALAQAEADPDIAALVITGTGDRAFCAGADLSKSSEAFGASGDLPTTDFGRLARRVQEFGKPVVARVNGACVAGGMAMLSMCDVAIAVDHARFGLPEVRVGVFPFQVIAYLRKVLTPMQLNELALTGELIHAERAAQMNLVNQVVGAEELDRRVDQLVEQIAHGSPSAVRRGKFAVRAMSDMTFEQALAFAEAQITLLSQSADAVEGMRAFVERRAPRWPSTIERRA